jgi:hypothetical protein
MRIYQLVRGLAARHDVTCLTFVPDAADALAPLRDVCRVETVIGPPPRSSIERAWTTAAAALPDMALRNASREYAGALGRLLAAQHFDLVQAESIEMAPYLLAIARRAGARRPRLVLDQFNVEYVLQKRAALASFGDAFGTAGSPKKRALGLAGGLYSAVQWAKLARFERRALRSLDMALAVSADDAALFKRLGATARLGIVPNGVDTAEFSRAALASREMRLAPATIVFSGTLDFRPNIDAVSWFARHVLPRIRERRPDAAFVVVGRRPAPPLQALADAGVLTLTGEVPDARPFIAGAAVYVVPMRIGGGVRLKLLEALSLEAPVVSTTMGAEGVEGLAHGTHCLLADDANTFAGAVVRLLGDGALGQQLGRAGRALVCSRYDWQQIVERLDALYREL